MQANESLVKKFGPLNVTWLVSTILILTSKLYIKVCMLDGEGLLAAKKRIFLAKTVAVHLIKQR